MTKICLHCIYYSYIVRYCDCHRAKIACNETCEQWQISYEHELEMLREENKKLRQQMQWIPVTERLPDNSKPVLAVVKEEMVTYVLRVMYARKFDIESETDYDEELFDYVEETDTYYCKPGWYETNVFEETHWGVCGEVTHWMPLPEPPKEGDNNG